MVPNERLVFCHHEETLNSILNQSIIEDEELNDSDSEGHAQRDRPQNMASSFASKTRTLDTELPNHCRN